MRGLVIGQSSIFAAAAWLEHLLLGSIATMIIALAVGTTGAAMLAGRIDVRRGATVILGCFLLFGAPVIAAGLYDVLTGGGNLTAEASSPAPKAISVHRLTDPYDPYAGAAVPQQR